MYRRKIGDVVLNAVLLLISVIWLVPLLWTVLMSFKDPNNINGLTHLLGGIQLSWQNFAAAWTSGQFQLYYINTIEICAGILIVQLLTITLAGYAFARYSFRGKSIVFVIFLLQLMIPTSALIVPNYLTIKDLGLVDTKWAIMLPYFASAMGTFLMRQTFRQIPRDLEEAAMLDGASWWQIIWYVLLPAARPGLVAFSLVSVSFHWNDFLWPLIVTQTPQNQPLTVGLSLLTQMGETGAQWSMITAGTLLVVLPLLVMFILFQKQFISSFIQSGIK
ncbi:Binding-protein-dependent transport system inner membrane component [Acididesulfobacillus acetoxydans]|uniref:Binding-protein-dependent transport system inner membrane component n=1 Tax=Acididesulfobacillus acetoxydans TaxID=1561005 RepID=A0A8S0X2W7_9FIRM|nr:carbohydrate ABC transporter permease [Acididesulfobacillus acetoxydans]CAA7599550.1 Binding-protein-dependent transport system inner membrane component [Acididesulfobacillus acetoxydans]CEJ07745.1 L-arabinose transport system permease protein AraQ [Acididesulfobacillus acetoxydans]